MKTCDLFSLAANGVADLQPYQPGKSVAELKRELGLDGIIKLASNENPLGPSSLAYQALAQQNNLADYPDNDGSELRQALSRLYTIDPQQITLGNGSSELLELLARTFVSPGQEIMYAQYSFAIYPLVTQLLGAKHNVVAAKDWGYDLEAMAKAVTDQTKLIFIANPNNPTGTWFDKSALCRLLDTISSNIIVVLDEAYYEYASGKADYPETLPLLSYYPNLAISRTFSKAYGLAGLRIGYVLSHPDMCDLLNRVRQPFNVNTLALTAACAVLADQAHVAKSVKLNNLGLAQLSQDFSDMGLAFIPSAGNFISVDLQRPGMAVYRALLKEGIIVRPVDNYAMPNHLRITVGLEQENAQFIRCLKKVLRGKD